ncbi:integrin alpha-6-like isoform X1 [Brienomyrus brachyistius]|uniref:integrin alpha-6-like isoform X1 n=1 Tax=Brienomyrus brachyistius TaxID=42636 RepID=UPI0020B2E92C|nr:integrin alpha-6-like isoform X1 [Brienomyrus brachyistius]
MACFKPCLCLFVTLPGVLQWTGVSGFNLDTENAFRKVGEPDSLFGFSLAMHRQLKPSDKRMLLIGAPRARALNSREVNITGGLYSCEVTPQANDCKRVIFDNDYNPAVEGKENQWMGVVVQSQGPGGKILTCAHRYQRRQSRESWDVTGRCYVLSQDLTINPKADEDGGSWKFCDGRPRTHEMFGYCQQGLSATFTKDYHYLVFGAPGAYNWKGIVRAEQRNSTLVEMNIFEDGPYEVGDENSFNPSLVPVPPNSYLGFSLDSGHNITKKGHLTIVAGAPRAHHSGAVVLLKKSEESIKMLSEEVILEGQGLASSFGYDVAVLDLNGDTWQDIVVGAPQYFVKDGEIGGAVYVYINRAGNWNQVKPILLTGPKDSMFGLAVENIGDLNQDSYGDFAVGAPYEMNGAGKVYIYHGSANGINIRPAQILQANDKNIKLFGYSLAGNMDLDSNSYPDVAVGSLSDAVFVYRAKPIINIEKSVKTSPTVIDLQNKNCGNSICMIVEACFKYTAQPKSYNPKLTIGYLFEAESERRKLNLPSRVTFMTKSNTDSDFQSSGTLELPGQDKAECVKVQLKLKDNLEDKLRSIPIDASVSIKSSKRRRRDVLPTLLPILNANEPSKSVSQIKFLKEGCGSDNICQSNLEMKYKFVYKEPNQNVFRDMPKKDGIPEMLLSDQKDIALEINVKNTNGDDAYETKLQAVIPNYLSYSKSLIETEEQQPFCNANKNGSNVECILGNPFKKNSEVTIYFILNTAGVTLDTNDIEVDLKLETTSEQANLTTMKAKAKVVIELLLSVSGLAKPSQVYFGGEVKGESYMTTEDDIGSLIEYQFRILNLGRPLKSFGTAYLNFQWPKETAEGKWILYLMKISTDGSEKIFCSPQTEINPLKYIKESSKSRSKRAAEEGKSESRLSPFKEKRKYKILMCGEEVTCVEIRCPLQDLDSNAVIVLRSRLWNSTFLEDFLDLNYLDIIVKASLQLDVSKQNTLLPNAETQVRVTVFPEKKMARYSGVPWWVILVAILAGILILSLLVFLLWKCGFFKRSRYIDIPKYSAVRIKRTEQNPGTPEKKQWMTTWKENESYS